MNRENFRTGITIALAIGSVSIAAFLYVTGRASVMQALNWPFLCWVALDLWYARKWTQLKKVVRMTPGEIYEAHRDGSMVPSSLWLSRTLDVGTWGLMSAMAIAFFRSI